MKNLQYRFNRMPDLCGGISMDGRYDCENPIVAGTTQRLLLINKSDWDLATIVYDIVKTNVITSIVLSTGTAYVFDGIRKSIAPQTAYVPSTVTSGYDHQIDFLVFDISSAQKLNIEAMVLSEGVVGIIQGMNEEGNSDSVFETFGAGVGMQVQASPMRINNDTESNSAYTISLKTSDDAGKEQHLPLSIWSTDFVTTKAMIDALIVP